MPSRTVPPLVPAAVALLRVSTGPGGLGLPEDLGRSDADAASWLALVWQREEVRTAVTIASPALAGQVGALATAAQPDAGQARRAARALASYLLRWQGRATPFGLFAGVGVARADGHSKASLGVWRVAARADAAWLGEVTARLHQCSELMERLPVVASDAIIVRGGRLVVPGHPSDSAAGELAPVEVSVRCSPPVRAAVEAAREPVPLGKLARQLRADFPAATQAQVRVLLDGLITHGVLVSGLYAPMTCPDALGHVCARLQEARAEEIPAVSGLASELAAIRQAIESAADGRVLLAVASRMTALSRVAEMPLAAEVAVDCDARIPEQVTREARDAAIVLHRVSPYPSGLPAWTGYHERFVARYGAGTLVPVLELVADSGLGLPAGYLGAALQRPAPAIAKRDRVLPGLVQKAMTNGSGEVVLTDEVITDLADGTQGEVRLPVRAEIAFEVRAASLEALDRGRFTLVISGAPRPGSSMIGRHAHVLDDAGRDKLAGTFAIAPDGAIAAQLSFAPRSRRNENVTRTAQLLPHVIPVGEHRHDDGGVIALGDLAVSADEDGLFLVHVPTGQLVEPRVAHALEAGVHTPPLARFLSEVSTGRCAAYSAFDFGAASRLPYLPRVRYRRTILSPARWLLAADDLPGPDAATEEWEAAFGTWRQQWRVPRHVAVTDHDRRLPLDLEHAFHRELLRSRLRRAGQLELRESAAPGELGWIGRAHQIVLPLALDAAVSRRAATAAPLVRRGTVATGDVPVRSRVLNVLAFGHPDRFDEILADHLPGLGAAVAEHAATWWFRRQPGTAQAGPHITVSLLLPDPDALGPAAGQAAAWADGLRRERLLSWLTLAVNDPQASRMPGWGPAAFRALAADSAAAIAQIAFTQRAGMGSAAVAAASMAGLAASLAPSPAEGMTWLAHALPREHGPVDRVLREQALRLADPAALIADIPGGPGVAAAWEHRAAALSSYRQHLTGHGGPEAALRFLLGEHQARVLDADGAASRVARHLARACALHFLATRPEEPGAAGLPTRREHV